MRLKGSLRCQVCLVMFLVLCLGRGRGQQASTSSSGPSLNDSIRELQQQIKLLQAAVQDIKQEAQQYRSEMLELKKELETSRRKLDSVDQALASTAGETRRQETTTNPGATQEALERRLERQEDNQQLLDAKVREQYQTKVESASKYRVRLSGLLLFNLFSNKGNVDHMEVPGFALPANSSLTGPTTGGSFGASFRQSQFGLEVYGPSLAGAKTRGDFVADFFGEFPETVNGSSSGSLRLRTGTVRLDWDRTSIVGGMDSIFFSPTYPTSFASLGVPALSYSGNLWAWMPQLRVEHRLKVSGASTVSVSGGIFDPLTGEAPPNEFLRIPGAGEASRQPGFGARLEWAHKAAGQALTLGVGGAYNGENWGFDRDVDGWVVNADWNIPLTSYFSLSGKAYTGRAIGGWGAGVGRSVVFNGPQNIPTTTVRGLPSSGGWAQLKFKPLAKLELNAAGGQDGVEAGDLRGGFNLAPGYVPANIARNRSEFVNFIYRPRSNLLLSTEFRTLRTFTVDQGSQRANQLNLMMGVFF